jgi:phosphoglucosamine mutase
MQRLTNSPNKISNGVKIFGTDGIRDVANSGWLTPESLLKLGKIIGVILHPQASVIIGRDTRISGQMIEEALSAGILSMGVNITDAGVISTPGLAYLSRQGNYRMGIMISASHNPADDNGVKLFGHNGLKINQRTELLIEKYLLSSLPKTKPVRPGLVSAGRAEVEQYINHLIKITFGKGLPLKGYRIALDCANGAVSAIAPELFTRLGAKVITLNCKPNGRNINLNCGALHPEAVSRAVKRHKADIGLSFDGDADRLMMVDDQGVIRDGDFVLAIVARYLKKYHRLPKHTVVGTIMTNTGLVRSLREIGVKLVTTPVGDKYVLDKMLSGGYVLGGEPSGHIIFSQYSLSGDGLLTALIMLKILKSEAKPLSILSQCLTKYPQLLVNVRVKTKPPINRIKPLMAKAAEVEQILGKEGRLSIRYSGTEPLLRIMIEGKDKNQIELLANQLADIVKRAL